MARLIRGTGFGVLGLAAGLTSQMLSAQALGLPASDPVGIGRSGTGVAFGQSLEAAALNPALLVTLKDPASVFLSAGLEMQSSQTTLMSTQHTLWSTDRNRALPALGGAWRLSDNLVLGVKLDDPFLRHDVMSDESTFRFQQQAIDLQTKRVEFQGAWSLNPNWSVGLGLGTTRVRYASQVALRVILPTDVNLPLGETNPSRALMELPMDQSGQGNAMTYSLGVRWAVNPRWTFAAAYQSAIRADLDMQAGQSRKTPSFLALDGSSTPEIGTETKGPAMLNATRAVPGNGKVVLPARAAIGVRQRYNQLLTWEVDLRYVAGKQFELPTQPALATPSGLVASPGVLRQPRNGYGISGTIEMTLTKKWTLRGGMEMLSGLLDGSTVEPFVGGTPTSGFSLGASYKALGGEWSLGYQYRQSKDEKSARLDGAWAEGGFSVSTTPTQVEGMGHLMSLGFKMAF